MPRPRRSGVPGLQQPTYRGRDGRRHRAKKWTLVVKRGGHKRCFALDTELYPEAERRAREKLAELDRNPEGPSRKPVDEHVGDWIETIRASARTAHHVNERERHLAEFVEGAEIATLRDLTGFAASRYLGKLLERGLSHSSLEHVRSALRAFSRWLTDEERIPRDPFRKLPPYNPEVDRRYERGAYTLLELRRLFKAAPLYREACYRLAFSTGLRRSELRRLARSAVDLKRGRVLAKLTKNGKPTWLALSRATVACLRRYYAAYAAGERRRGAPLGGLAAGLALPEGVPELDRDREGNAIGGLARDLAAAGIPVMRDGHPRDFHSFRVSYNTLMAARGVKRHVRQRLMRHGDGRLTDGPIYLRDLEPEEREAVERLDRAPRKRRKQAS